MKNKEKFTELQKCIDASKIEEGMEVLQRMLGYYIRLEKMKTKKQEIRLGYLEVIGAIWKMEEALKFITEKSEEWETATKTTIFHLK